MPKNTSLPNLTGSERGESQNRIAVSEYVIAEQLDLSVHTIRKDRQKDRRIPFYRIGTTIRYNLDRVREALAATECGGIAQK